MCKRYGNSDVNSVRFMLPAETQIHESLRPTWYCSSVSEVRHKAKEIVMLILKCDCENIEDDTEYYECPHKRCSECRKVHPDGCSSSGSDDGSPGEQPQDKHGWYCTRGKLGREVNLFSEL